MKSKGRYNPYHDPRYPPSGQKMVDVRRFRRIEDYIYKIYVEKTGQSYDIIQQDLKRTRLMSAKEAQDYGIIDRILTVNVKET